ncbi:GTP dependend phosphoenolpyruvate carboxykinase pckG [Cupriavidus necator N-1]|uniref:GTP dependend phosphoenolpyruvate carboxykinase pckG n=1 Tax=Cupriavidus necator (strain ATCC 43291 / DSM 13513 / CCUG 52238 / LMG 8453 / N-1) TaxID=1042878 RepID=G0F0R9_CUPNN|nr:GTP dependend phosphoenolpyruvate carboxykinase pckG [Cupriavidus necator N-1]
MVHTADSRFVKGRKGRNPCKAWPAGRWGRHTPGVMSHSDRHIPLQLRGGPVYAKGRGGPCGCATVALRARRGGCAGWPDFVRVRSRDGSKARPTIRGGTGTGKDTTGAPPCFLLCNNRCHRPAWGFSIFLNNTVGRRAAWWPRAPTGTRPLDNQSCR